MHVSTGREGLRILLMFVRRVHAETVCSQDYLYRTINETLRTVATSVE